MTLAKVKDPKIQQKNWPAKEFVLGLEIHLSNTFVIGARWRESIFHPGKTDSVNQKRNYLGTVRGQLKPHISFLLTARR